MDTEDDNLVHEGSNVNEDHLKCGWGCCKPKCCSRFANMKFFTVVYIAQIILFIMAGTYFFASLRTIEKRFGFNSKQTGILASVGDIVQTCFLIFIGYFARKSHKPRFLGVCLVIASIGLFMTGMPYYIYGAKHSAPAYDSNSNLSLTDGVETESFEDKMQSFFNQAQKCSADSQEQNKCNGDENGANDDRFAYSLFLLGFIVMGFGNCGLQTLGMTYIDENLKKEDTALYIGFISSFLVIGPILGFGFAAVGLKQPEDLHYSPFTPTDPKFIGAWWLGTAVISLLMCIFSVMLLFFPKHFPAYYKYHKTKSSEKDESKTTLKNELEGLPKAIWSLLKNEIFICLTLVILFSLYKIIGIYMNLSRYLEIYFRVPAFLATILAALGGTFTAAFGALLSGYIVKYKKLGPIGCARMLLLILILGFVGIVIQIFVACPQSALQGNPIDGSRVINLETSCNADCDCVNKNYMPVCDVSGNLYFSPCHAGCKENNAGNFTECKCLAANETVSLDQCEGSCSSIYVYIAIEALAAFVSSMTRVPALNLLFRSVPTEMKSTALAISGTVYNALGFAVGPIIFGTLFDATCKVWEDNCGETGSCLIYDTTAYRFVMHGGTAIALFGSVVCGILLVYFTQKRFSKKNNNEEEDQA